MRREDEGSGVKRNPFWICRRVTDGVKCNAINSKTKRKCPACGKPRPAKRRPKHMAALELVYEQYVALNGGEHCGICGRKPSARRRLDRDHDHASAAARGLLCSRCNRALPSWCSPSWLRAAAAYLERKR
jgi:hypothetical protein